MKDKPKNTHGGQRPGSGRKKTGATETVVIRVPADMVELIRALVNRVKKVRKEKEVSS